jgi:hypothetical protein
MTDTTNDDLFSEKTDRIIADGLRAVDEMRAHVKRIEQSKDAQPERLAKARSAAEEARGWALIEDGWDDHVAALPAHNADGERTGNSLTLPSITARELWGARLCFDLLDCDPETDEVDDVISRMFTMVHGDTGLAMILMSSALTTIATLVVPELLSQLETRASDYDQRVLLAEARAKAWNGRVSELQGLQDEATEAGIKPIDGFDLGANALDPDTATITGEPKMEGDE